MAELEKMNRTAAKVIPARRTSSAGSRRHHRPERPEPGPRILEPAGVTGIVLTKLDGTAKGGIVVAIARELNLPIRFVGTGEQIDDLVPFDAQTYVNSLFD